MVPFYGTDNASPYTIFPNEIAVYRTDCGGTITISHGPITTSPTISSHETPFTHYYICYQQREDQFKEELNKLTLPLKCSTLHKDVFKERINKVESQTFKPINLQVNARSRLPRKERNNET